MKNLLINLGSKIREARHKMGVSQEELAHICGFDRTYISMLERGKRNPSFSNLARLSFGLETTVEELTKGIEYNGS